MYNTDEIVNATLNRVYNNVVTKSELDNYKMILTRNIEDFENRIKILEKENADLKIKIAGYDARLAEYDAKKKSKEK